MLDAAPSLIAAFTVPGCELVYANAAARARFAPAEDDILPDRQLSDLVGLASVQRFQSEFVPQARVVGNWSGACELRDAWGSEFAAAATLTLVRAGAARFLFLHAVPAGPEPSEAPTQFDDRHLLRALLENLPETVYFKDASSRFIRISRSQAKKLGVGDPSAAIGRTDFDFFAAAHASDAYADEQTILKTGQAVVDKEEKETWDDGRVAWVSTTKLPLRDGAGRIIGTFGISHEITARKAAEEARRQMELQLQLASKLESLGRLAAGVAHEINTPTQFINDNTHFLLGAVAKVANVLATYHRIREVASKHPDLAEAVAAVAAAETEAELDYLLVEMPRSLEQSLEGLERVARIVRSLKEFAHPNSPDPVPSDLNRSIETAVAVTRHEWKYVAEVNVELDPELPLVPCAVDEFNQVMLNLIINAAHAIALALKQSGERRGRITIRTRRDAEHAVVEVADNGTGMTDDVRARLFEPFFTTKGVGQGTGQGLAIVHAVIVKHHQGSIDVATAVGSGTTFTLRLPLTRPAVSAAI